MTNHTNVLMYFFQAGLIVKGVMVILLIASLISWTFIFQRAWYFAQKKRQSKQFEERFWQSNDLSKLYTELDQQKGKRQGLAAIFHAGFKEFVRGRRAGQLNKEMIERGMQVMNAKEAQQFEKHLPFLASVGSIAPYIGLFGTVWGIMTSLQSLGQAQQATIAMVAPGISEALVATALGLFTAIPAVLAYNRYTTHANTILNRYELFQEELIALIERQTSQETVTT